MDGYGPAASRRCSVLPGKNEFFIQQVGFVATACWSRLLCSLARLARPAFHSLPPPGRGLPVSEACLGMASSAERRSIFKLQGGTGKHVDGDVLDPLQCRPFQAAGGTAFEMPRRGECPDLEDAALMITAEDSTQHDAIARCSSRMATVTLRM